MITIGGGTVLNTLLNRISRRNTDKTIQYLRRLESGSPKEKIVELAERSLSVGISEDQIMSQTLTQRATIQEILRDLASSKQVRILSESPY